MLVKRRLRLELASVDGGDLVAGQIRKRLITIGRAKSVLDWNRIKPLARDIDAQREAIIQHVAPHDPATAFDLMARLMALAGPVYMRCDDGNGVLGDVFDTALGDLVALAPASQLSSAALADRVFDALCENDFGQYDRLIALMAGALGDNGLAHLRQRFEQLAASPPQPPPDDEREAIGYGPGGPIYADQIEARRHARTVQEALTEIADALQDVDAFIALQPAGTRNNPAIAADIAERLLKAGRAGEAMDALDAASAKRSAEGWWPAWDRVRIVALGALGRAAEAQASRWHLFAKTLDSGYLAAYLRALPDFEDAGEEARAMAHVASFHAFHHALLFLVEWPNVDAAAKLVLARANEIDGDHYTVLAPAAEALEPHHPLAATLVLRAMIDFALEKARTKRYLHAIRHLRSCDILAQRITNFGEHAGHAAYVAGLKAQYGKRRGFWQD